MKQPLDERVRLPRFLKHLLFMIFGLSGVMMMNRPQGVEYDYFDSLILLVSAIYGALASYGAFNLLHDIKKHKTVKDFLNNIINKFEITFYDDNRNSN